MRVDDVDDVVRAADVAEVLSDALAEIHASIACALYQYQLVRRLAFCAEIFRLADDVFGSIYTHTHTHTRTVLLEFTRQTLINGSSRGV